MAYHLHSKTNNFHGKFPMGALLLAVLFLLTQSGCTRQQVYENLYEGVRVRNELQTPPPERGTQQNPQDYWLYQHHINVRDGASDNP